jgi:hypothetical protein
MIFWFWRGRDHPLSGTKEPWVAPNVDNGLTVDLVIKAVGLGIYE